MPTNGTDLCNLIIAVVVTNRKWNIKASHWEGVGQLTSS